MEARGHVTQNILNGPKGRNEPPSNTRSWMAATCLSMRHCIPPQEISSLQITVKAKILTDDEVDEIFKKIDNPDYDGKVNDFKYRFERIHQSIEQIERLQTTLRSVESRDRHIAERNYEKVNFWSMVNLAVMVTVLIVQVFLIQSLFDEKSLLNRQLNKISAFNSN